MSEVGQSRLPPAVNHDVRGLEIAMQHASIVSGSEPGADLSRRLDAFVGRQASDAPQQRGKILAIHELHRQEVPPIDVRDVVDTADVRM